MSTQTKYRVVLTYANGDRHICTTTDTRQEAERYIAASPAPNYSIEETRAQMYVPERGPFHLPQDVRRTIAQALVTAGGEQFHELVDEYERELREQVNIHWYAREDTDDTDPDHAPTGSDLTYITSLVARATITVHLPDEVDDKEMDSYYDEGATLDDLG